MSKKNTLKINNSVLTKTIDNIVTKEARRYQTIGNQVNEEIRKKYTLSWFINETSTMINSLEFDCERNTIGSIVRLTFTSWINIDKYEAIKSQKENNAGIYSWCHRAQLEGVSTPLSPAEYIVDLQWRKGILGLPYKATARKTDWKNPHYHKKDLLSKVIQKAYREHWEKEINKRYKQKWSD